MKHCQRRVTCLFALLLLLARGALCAPVSPDNHGLRQESDAGISHAFLACGAETYITDGAGRIVWTYPANTRDGYVLPNGNVLLAVSKGGEFPGGGAVE